MKFFSTRGQSADAVDMKTALLGGLAVDGGLYIPQQIPKLSRTISVTTFPELAEQLAIAWFGEDIAHDVLHNIVRAAYDFPVPTIKVGDRFVCELFHGPSLSFKDFAAQFFLRVLDHLLTQDDERAVILTATSGDTGSAVAAACYGRQRLRAVVLYPKGRISPTQEQQITTWGGNVTAVAVPGTFDDCQRLVKVALTAPAIPNVHLTSANSINIGRLLPQTLYYWWIALQHPNATIVVPSGNFGNLTAGVLAKRMGAPIAGFIAATNANDAVPRYLHDGRYDPRATQHTVSNAMDVGAPSNFERLRFLYDDDIESMRRELSAVAVTDAQTTRAIIDVYQQRQYLLDPHTAVAWCAATQSASGFAPDVKPVILATAHPAKFSEVIAPLIGTAPPAPKSLVACVAKPRHITELAEASDQALQKLLRKL